MSSLKIALTALLIVPLTSLEINPDKQWAEIQSDGKLMRGEMRHRVHQRGSINGSGTTQPVQHPPSYLTAINRGADSLGGVLEGLHAKFDLSLNPRDLETYPEDLRALGSKIFGSSEALQSFVKQLDDPKIVKDDGIELYLVQSHGDTSVVRLNAEMDNDQYGIRKVNATNGLIIDVGGNIGDMAIASALIHPDLQVLALEPVPSTYFIMRLNMRLTNVKELAEKDLGVPGKAGVVALNKALTKDGRDVNITYDIHSSQDSVTNANKENDLMSRWSHAQVPSINLAKYVESHKAGPVRLLKMDCEGCEFEAIPSMKGWFENKTKVEKLTAEIHRSVQNATIDKIRAAAKPDDDELSQTDKLLKQRGCEVGPKAWKVDC